MDSSSSPDTGMATTAESNTITAGIVAATVIFAAKSLYSSHEMAGVVL